MKREETIKKLEHYRYCLKFQYGWYSKEDDKVFDMAIKALEQEHCLKMRPATEQEQESVNAYIDSISTSIEQKTGWIPVKFRPLTKEEQEEYPHYCYFADCLMPADGEEILVTTRHGTVEKDEAGFDEGFYLDSGYDWGTDVIAWMPLPEPYKESEG